MVGGTRLHATAEASPLPALVPSSVRRQFRIGNIRFRCYFMMRQGGATVTQTMRQGTDGGCVVIRTGGSYDGKQGVALSTGVSRGSAGSQALCMHVLTIPPGTRGTPHLHDGHETAIYIAEGEVEVWHGPGLAMGTVLRAGDFLYVPPGTPHLPVNRSASPMVAVVARTDPAEQESVVVLDLPPRLESMLAGFAVAADG
jgi:uncharacterized RmlC-like cupin family protein